MELQADTLIFHQAGSKAVVRVEVGVFRTAWEALTTYTTPTPAGPFSIHVRGQIHFGYDPKQPWLPCEMLLAGPGKEDQHYARIIILDPEMAMWAWSISKQQIAAVMV